ncbi:MAG: 5'-3' exonuclease H3TH domain-containing protein, partial [Synechococcus sp.]|nr:5'-3' exonuclease H3TH domain-containing protein [Synechococcus sp.]
MLEERPLLLLIDGHSLAFRSYYAFSKGSDGGLSTQAGVPTSVTYGFLKALLDTCRGLRPDGLVVAFDTAEPTFRHQADDAYKAHRDEAPEAFFQDLQNLQRILQEGLDLPLVMAPGYEADDVLGTLANRAADQGWRVRILSGDRDLFQLVDDARDIAVLYMGGGPYARNSGPSETRRDQVIARLGVPPEDVVALKALTGDSSDNIPGVRGVGPKTAINLLAAYDHIDGIYAALDALEQAGPRARDPKGVLKGALLQKLRDDRENAYRSRMLAEILVDIPLPQEPRLKLGTVNSAALAGCLEELELYSLARQVGRFAELFSAELPAAASATSPAAPGGSPSGAEALSGTAAAPVSGAPVSGGVASMGIASTAAAHGLAADAATAAAEPVPEPGGIPELRPELISTAAALEALLARLLACTDPAAPVALDTETTSLNPFRAELVGLGVAWGEGPADLAYIPIGHQVLPAVEADLLAGASAAAAPEPLRQLPLEQVLTALAPWLASAAHPKTLQNAKYDRLILLRHGL